MNGPSLKYNKVALSYDQYVRIFNRLMRPRRTTHYFGVLLKIFNIPGTFKKGGVLSTLHIFKPKGSNVRSRSISTYFNPKDLGAQSSQVGKVDVY